MQTPLARRSVHRSACTTPPTAPATRTALHATVCAPPCRQRRAPHRTAFPHPGASADASVARSQGHSTTRRSTTFRSAASSAHGEGRCVSGSDRRRCMTQQIIQEHEHERWTNRQDARAAACACSLSHVARLSRVSRSSSRAHPTLLAALAFASAPALPLAAPALPLLHLLALHHSFDPSLPRQLYTM